MIVRQFISWVRTAPAGERAEATRSLARALLFSDMSNDDRGGRLRAAREHLGHRLAHQRRWIVEQHQERAFGGGAVVFGKI